VATSSSSGGGSDAKGNDAAPVSAAFTKLVNALRGDNLKQFETAVNALDDKTTLMRLHGARRQSILHEAAERGHVGVVERLLRDYATAIDQVQADGRTPLHCAAAAGRVAVCRALLTAKADRKIKDATGAVAAQLFAGSTWPATSLAEYDFFD
jgi:ankyrin repeat protein